MHQFFSEYSHYYFPVNIHQLNFNNRSTILNVEATDNRILELYMAFSGHVVTLCCNLEGYGF
jgi:hypothetical protein